MFTKQQLNDCWSRKAPALGGDNLGVYDYCRSDYCCSDYCCSDYCCSDHSIDLMKRVLLLLIVGFAAFPLSVATYALWWAVHYRMPPSPCALVDLRRDPSEAAFYITFCASLATNPHGFPGHSYVVWSRTPNWNNEDAEAFGFVPRYSRDQIASVFTYVPGLMVPGASEGNMANLDSLTVVVDSEKYDETLRMREQWDSNTFRAGLHDCVSFMDFIAQDTGLKVPIRRFSYPQDHLKQMKALNQSVFARNSKSLKKWEEQFELKKLCHTDDRSAVQF
jgi:hypothetical protein